MRSLIFDLIPPHIHLKNNEGNWKVEENLVLKGDSETNIEIKQ